MKQTEIIMTGSKHQNTDKKTLFNITSVCAISDIYQNILSTCASQLNLRFFFTKIKMIFHIESQLEVRCFPEEQQQEFGGVNERKQVTI